MDLADKPASTGSLDSLIVGAWQADMHIYDVFCHLSFEPDGSVEYSDTGFQGAWWQEFAGLIFPLSSSSSSSNSYRLTFDKARFGIDCDWLALDDANKVDLLIECHADFNGTFIVDQPFEGETRKYADRLQVKINEVKIGGQIFATDHAQFPAPLRSWVNDGKIEKVFYRKWLDQPTEAEEAEQRRRLEENCRQRGIAVINVEVSTTEEGRRRQNERVMELIRKGQGGRVPKMD